MAALKGKKILLGLSGGIAAYKSLSLIRLFVKAGAEVKCVCTPAALEFVTPLSVETLSGNPLYSGLFSPKNEFKTAHVSLADWADLLVVAPATANTLAKFACGIADNALTTLFNAFDKPVVVVPAMNTRMYRNPATVANLNLLKDRGVFVMEPDCGDLACGTRGEGRMPEAETLFAYTAWVCRHFCRNEAGTNSGASAISSQTPCARNARPDWWSFYEGKKVLLTAGPTVEALDPVRFLSNHSSGLMGSCLADELSLRGARVYFVSGPGSCQPRFAPYRLLPVQTASQMYEASMELWPEMDLAILSAAVADYSPVEVSDQKIKKGEDGMLLALQKTKDILASLGRTKKADQILVGFALETENELGNARQKLERKNADLIVLNSLRNPGAGFACATNQVTLVDRKGNVVPQSLKSKEEVASDILDYVPALLEAV